MEPIQSSRQKNTGIEVFWQEGTIQRRDFFSFTELIDMRINAIDLLDHPELYRIEGDNHRLLATDQGCCTYTTESSTR